MVDFWLLLLFDFLREAWGSLLHDDVDWHGQLIIQDRLVSDCFATVLNTSLLVMLSAILSGTVFHGSPILFLLGLIQ